MVKYEHEIGITKGTPVEKFVAGNFEGETREKMANAEKREASEKAEEAGIETAADFFRESSKDEGRHYKILEGILERYF